MPAYRFCRPDDIPLLVEAVNTCYCPHFPNEPLWDVTRFKKEVRERNLWASSCMLAFGPDGKTPVGVVLGCKRAHATLIHLIGVHPEHQRQGHATHLLTSLSAKLAVLGPPELMVELPEGMSGLEGILRKLDYQPVGKLTDYLSSVLPEPGADNECIGELSFEQVRDHGFFEFTQGISWDRTLLALENRKTQLQALAFASVDALEAVLFYSRVPAQRRVDLDLFLVRDSSVKEMFFSVLLRTLVGKSADSIFRVHKISEVELDSYTLSSVGFRKQKSYTIYTGKAAS